MSLRELKADQLVRAIQLFLEFAYSGSAVPSNRSQFQDLSPAAPMEELLQLPGVERLPSRLGEDPGGYSFRIGNAWYPHMKLTVQIYGSAPGYVFGVDTHDMFNIPANAPDYEEVQKLRLKNQELARQIERAWESDGLPTQNGLLRSYLNQVENRPPEEG
jgi:hypothetical protein